MYVLLQYEYSLTYVALTACPSYSPYPILRPPESGRFHMCINFRVPSALYLDLLEYCFDFIDFGIRKLDRLGVLGHLRLGRTTWDRYDCSHAVAPTVPQAPGKRNLTRSAAVILCDAFNFCNKFEILIWKPLSVLSGADY